MDTDGGPQSKLDPKFDDYRLEYSYQLPAMMHFDLAKLATLRRRSARPCRGVAELFCRETVRETGRKMAEKMAESVPLVGSLKFSGKFCTAEMVKKIGCCCLEAPLSS